MLRRLPYLLFVFLILAAYSWPARGDVAMIAMRDGVKLATEYHLPEGEGPWPVMLLRSVYGRGMDPKDLLARGYAVVVQDTRGRGGSEGRDEAFQADGWRAETQDGADTVAWIKAQPWCDGKVATSGGSALGITQVLMAPVTEGLACQLIDVAASNFYGHLSYQGGVFRKSMCEGWLTMQKIPYVIDLWKSHPAHDTFWAYYNAEEQAAKVTAPALHVGGWYDIFAEGTVNNFLTRQHHGGPGARGKQILIMKWSGHGPDKTEDMKFQENRFDLKISHIKELMTDYYCKGIDDGFTELPAVMYYVMGDDRDPAAPGMQWRSAADWPPFETVETAYFLAPNGMLTTESPVEEASASFTYDPRSPFPTHGGANLLIPYGPYDQRTVNKDRDDVLKFATAPLAEPTEMTGQVRVDLWISSDCPDTDFTAKLIDVYPEGDGRELLVMDSIQRVKFRDGFERPAALLSGPDEVVKLTIHLGPISWIFNTEHRIGLHISSSNFPRFEKNPNNGDDFPGDESTFRVAGNTVHFRAAYPSALVAPLRDASRDEDGDGIPTREEWAAGTNPDDSNSKP